MFDLVVMAEADRALEALSTGQCKSEKRERVPAPPRGDIAGCPHLAEVRERAA